MSSGQDNGRSGSDNVVSLIKFREKKTTEDEFSRGRRPLYVSHLDGKVSGQKDGKPSQDFGDRYQRIKASLEKINRLMSELKKLSTGSGEGDDKVANRNQK